MAKRPRGTGCREAVHAQGDVGRSQSGWPKIQSNDGTDPASSSGEKEQLPRGNSTASKNQPPTPVHIGTNTWPRFYGTVEERDAALCSTFGTFQAQPHLIVNHVARFL